MIDERDLARLGDMTTDLDEQPLPSLALFDDHPEEPEPRRRGRPEGSRNRPREAAPSAVTGRLAAIRERAAAREAQPTKEVSSRTVAAEPPAEPAPATFEQPEPAPAESDWVTTTEAATQLRRSSSWVRRAVIASGLGGQGERVHLPSLRMLAATTSAEVEKTEEPAATPAQEQPVEQPTQKRITHAEAAAILGLSPKGVHDLRVARQLTGEWGELPSHPRAGKNWHYLESDVRALTRLRQQPRKPKVTPKVHVPAQETTTAPETAQEPRQTPETPARDQEVTPDPPGPPAGAQDRQEAIYRAGLVVEDGRVVKNRRGLIDPPLCTEEVDCPEPPADLQPQAQRIAQLVMALVRTCSQLAHDRTIDEYKHGKVLTAVLTAVLEG